MQSKVLIVVYIFTGLAFASGHVFINEINEWPDTVDNFVELYNNGSQAEDMADYWLVLYYTYTTNMATTLEIPLNGYTIGAFEYFLIGYNCSFPVDIQLDQKLDRDGVFVLYRTPFSSRMQPVVRPDVDAELIDIQAIDEQRGQSLANHQAFFDANFASYPPRILSPEWVQYFGDPTDILSRGRCSLDIEDPKFYNLLPTPGRNNGCGPPVVYRKAYQACSQRCTGPRNTEVMTDFCAWGNCTDLGGVTVRKCTKQDCQSYIQVFATGNFVVYADGHPVLQKRTTETNVFRDRFLPKGTNVVAIRVFAPWRGIKGITVAVNNVNLPRTRWRCSATLYPNWFKPWFDRNRFEKPAIQGKAGKMGLPTPVGKKQEGQRSRMPPNTYYFWPKVAGRSSQRIKDAFCIAHL